MGVKTQLGRVTGSAVTKNKDGAGNVRLLQVEITDPDDIQSIQLMGLTGIDSAPVNGSKVTIVSIGSAFKLVIATDDGIEPEVSEGEIEFYSSASGAKQARLKLKADGTAALASPTESLDVLISDLIDAIVGIVTVGSATTQALDSASQAALNAIKARFTDLLGGV